MFATDQLVVCVREFDPSVLKHSIARPSVGMVYTVRHVDQWQWTATRDYVEAILLNEIVNPTVQYLMYDGRVEVQEPHFPAEHFRPVRPTSIEVFRQMLQPAHDKVLR